jgi:hypothetical protein
MALLHSSLYLDCCRAGWSGHLFGLPCAGLSHCFLVVSASNLLLCLFALVTTQVLTMVCFIFVFPGSLFSSCVRVVCWLGDLFAGCVAGWVGVYFYLIAHYDGGLRMFVCLVCWFVVCWFVGCSVGYETPIVTESGLRHG